MTIADQQSREASSMTSAENWKSFFLEWPADFPHSGIVLSTLNEAMPFRNFWLRDDMLLLERTNPDAMGGRFLILGFEVINSVKFTSPLSDAVIDGSGFTAVGSENLQASY
jgi:hypothetical protein